MNLKEIGTAVFTIDLDELDLFIIEESKGEIFLEVFGMTRNIFTTPKIKTLFVHIMNEYMIVARAKKFEYSLVREKKLIDFYNEKGLKTPKERNNMFSNYKITSVKLGEINDIALECAVEKIADQLKNAEIRTKGDKTFLVQNGTVVELTGEEFSKQMTEYMVGKTVFSVRNSKTMSTIIENLGIIEEVTLVKQKDSLSSILG